MYMYVTHIPQETTTHDTKVRYEYTHVRIEKKHDTMVWHIHYFESQLAGLNYTYIYIYMERDRDVTIYIYTYNFNLHMNEYINTTHTLYLFRHNSQKMAQRYGQHMHSHPKHKHDTMVWHIHYFDSHLAGLN